MNIRRSSGILLHPSSLPGPHGIGDFGSEALRFVDLLSETGQSIWQLLPLGPTGYGDSPYSCFSAFAGNPLLISMEGLVEQGDLDPRDLKKGDCGSDHADFGFAFKWKWPLLKKGARHFAQHASPERRQAYRQFCDHQAYWLNDYALFQGLREQFGNKPWNLWPDDIRHRREEALRHWGEQLAETIDLQKYAQFIFHEQWFALKGYANKKGVRIMGDIPIFIAFDSVDVWANSHLFHLDDEGNPTLVAGVPPDYFSATGQRWGNPLYRWDLMAKDDYSWWKARFRWNLHLTDLVRIDHFRGFESCWAIPAEEETAINGQWVPVPGAELFECLGREFGELPVVAEDLGIITPEVEALRDRFGFPGMKILQFAFGSGANNPYLPHNYTQACVVYTGTHDNNTTLGWWKECTTSEKKSIKHYLGNSTCKMPWELIRLAQASVARLCVFPLQDLLELDGSGRMNRPGQGQGNWDWRCHTTDLDPGKHGHLTELTRDFGRWPATGLK